jgi:hypothetical protein
MQIISHVRWRTMNQCNNKKRVRELYRCRFLVLCHFFLYTINLSFQLTTTAKHQKTRSDRDEETASFLQLNLPDGTKRHFPFVFSNADTINSI